MYPGVYGTFHQSYGFWSVSLIFQTNAFFCGHVLIVFHHACLLNVWEAIKSTLILNLNLNSPDCLTDAHFHFHRVTKEPYCHDQGRVDVSLDMMKAALDPQVMEPCTITLGMAVDSCIEDTAGRVPTTQC